MMRRSSHIRKSVVLLAIALGCGEPEAERSTAPIAAQPVETPVDAGVRPHDAGPPRPPARLFAKRFVTKIRQRPDRDSFRLGYLRAGAVVMATTADPVRTDDPRCPRGWYELTTGGFVCNGRDVIAFWGRRLPQVRGAQPDRTAPLPYEYGRNRRDQAPMYRRLPTDLEAAEFEGFQIPGQPEAAPALAPGESPPVENANPAPAEPVVAPLPPPVAPPPSPPPPSPAPPVPAMPTPEGEEPAEEGDVVTLRSLEGDPASALMRRLVSGFIVSLDRDFRAGQYGRRYWRTISNGFVPYGGMGLVRAPEFRGARVDISQLPIGFIISRNEVFYERSGERARRGGAVEFHHRLQIVGEQTIGDTLYYAAADGRLYRERDVRRIAPRERPEGVGPREKWIEVNLSGQYLIAYEGDRPVYATLISTGRAHHPDDPTANFLTPTGLFRIRAKHLAATMDGDTAADGPYSIDDVPWVMYFQLAYALHGAFWHNAFGYPRSHGCVNLAPLDAQWVFNWSDPQLPEGWHGSYPTDDAPGTWIYIHGTTPGAEDD
jgi:hypothetical protein